MDSIRKPVDRDQKRTAKKYLAIEIAKQISESNQSNSHAAPKKMKKQN